MTDADREVWVRDLMRDEGTGPVVKGRLMPYADSEGYTTLGFGRCIELRGISLDEAHVLLRNDMKSVEVEMATSFPWAVEMTGARQRALAGMLFNMGLTKLLGFTTTLAAMKAGDYKGAAAGMRASKWARQTKGRAKRLAKQMETGEDA